jgi:hypothetical protein
VRPRCLGLRKDYAQRANLGALKRFDEASRRFWRWEGEGRCAARMPARSSVSVSPSSATQRRGLDLHLPPLRDAPRCRIKHKWPHYVAVPAEKVPNPRVR